ncbi:interleukin 15, like isoform X2 [Channa argus]|uniref:interleukin 15, like isoform X2 n=1 Tax=Channa argus TaxID=215402 RepID=UPI0035205BC9
MLRGTPSLVSVFLCFVCLHILTPHPATRRCTQDTIRRVNVLIEKAPSLTWLNTRLYTPKSTDHEKCPSSTLKCFAAEVKVLTEEWMEVVENFPRLKLDKMLYTLASTFKQAESDCPECELLQEENAENFLNCLLSTLQCMNSLYCNR